MRTLRERPTALRHRGDEPPELRPALSPSPAPDVGRAHSVPFLPEEARTSAPKPPALFARLAPRRAFERWGWETRRSTHHAGRVPHKTDSAHVGRSIAVPWTIEPKQVCMRGPYLFAMFEEHEQKLFGLLASGQKHVQVFELDGDALVPARTFRMPMHDEDNFALASWIGPSGTVCQHSHRRSRARFGVKERQSAYKTLTLCAPDVNGALQTQARLSLDDVASFVRKSGDSAASELVRNGGFGSYRMLSDERVLVEVGLDNVNDGPRVLVVADKQGDRLVVKGALSTENRPYDWGALSENTFVFGGGDTVRRRAGLRIVRIDARGGISFAPNTVPTTSSFQRIAALADGSFILVEPASGEVSRYKVDAEGVASQVGTTTHLEEMQYEFAVDGLGRMVAVTRESLELLIPDDNGMSVVGQGVPWGSGGGVTFPFIAENGMLLAPRENGMDKPVTVRSFRLDNVHGLVEQGAPFSTRERGPFIPFAPNVLLSSSYAFRQPLERIHVGRTP